MVLKFKLIKINDPVTEEFEFDTLEALQAKVAELTPPVPAEAAPETPPAA